MLASSPYREMLGLPHDQNFLVDYSPEWPRLFIVEKRSLAAAFGPLPHAIEHVGSTSVEGMKAKPILDILIGIPRLDGYATYRPVLETLGYDHATQAGVPGHQIFGRGRTRDERTHIVHFVEMDGACWRAMLAFRDALRADPRLRAEYEATKTASVKKAPDSRARYNELKAGFFAKLNLHAPGRA